MQKFQLRFWHPIAGYIFFLILYTINENLVTSIAIKSLIADLQELGVFICQILLLYIIIRNIVRAIKGLIARRSSGEAEELERQREIERKEIDMVRKSNEILLHLIQDEHREEGDR